MMEVTPLGLVTMLPRVRRTHPSAVLTHRVSCHRRQQFTLNVCCFRVAEVVRPASYVVRWYHKQSRPCVRLSYATPL